MGNPPKYVSLLPFKAEGKKLVIEDCPKVQDEELNNGSSSHVKGVAN